MGWTPGPIELIVILIVVLLIFGKRIPNTMRSLGKGILEFKRGMKDAQTPEKLPPPNGDTRPHA